MNQLYPYYLSIVIPCYNSGKVLLKNIPVLVNFLKSLEISYEIIVVDDGSKMDQAVKFTETDYSVSYIYNKVNKGKGYALKTGIQAAQGRFIMFTDADIPFQPEVIKQMLKYLDLKEFNMVVGDRTLKGATYFQGVTTMRSYSSKLFSKIVGNFIAGGWYDTQCGIKAFDHQTAKNIFSLTKINGFAIDVELFYLALKANLDIKRVPVNLRSNDGDSVSTLKHGMRMLYDTASVIYFYYTGKYNISSLIDGAKDR